MPLHIVSVGESAVKIGEMIIQFGGFGVVCAATRPGRFAEKIGHQVKTFHRLLQYCPTLQMGS